MGGLSWICLHPGYETPMGRYPSIHLISRRGKAHYNKQGAKHKHSNAQAEEPLR